jgi:lysophospholipase L1-like esterase
MQDLQKSDYEITKDYVRMRNIKRATIISLDQLITPTAGLSEYLQQEELRGGDPVHYTPKGYSLAAAGLEALIYEERGGEGSGGESRETAGQEGQS